MLIDYIICDIWCMLDGIITAALCIGLLIIGFKVLDK